YKDLTRVGAVSKRCRQFHLSVPVVDFGSINSPKGQTNQYLARPLSSLDGYLLDRGHNRIQRFHIRWSFFKTETVKKLCDDQFRVLMWICNALRCNFEELDFRFSHNLQYLELRNVSRVDEKIFKWISCCCKCIKEQLAHGWLC
ncbi:hypothetical protein DVH24_004919, partial [Malus domestica]